MLKTQSNSENPFSGPASSGDLHHRDRSCWAVAAIPAVLVLLIVVSVASVMLGKILEEDSHRRAQIERQRPILQEILTDGSPAYGNIEICNNSTGYAFLSGSVEQAEDLDSLRQAVMRQFGESLANKMVVYVTVNERTVEQTGTETEPARAE